MDRQPLSVDNNIRQEFEDREDECRRILKLVEDALGGPLSLNSKTLINDAVVLHQSGN